MKKIRELLKFEKYKYLMVLILVVMFGIMLFSAFGDSATMDEKAHIPSGYSYVTTGDYRLNPEHPPLIKDLTGISLLFDKVKFPYDLWRSNGDGRNVNNQWDIGYKFLYEMGNDPDVMLVYSRLPLILLSLVFGYFVFRWARELYGPKAGILALVLYAFNANIIAHSRYVTTDMGISFAFFISMYFLYRYLKKPNLKTLFWAGIMFGVVLITKFSAATLVPTFGIVWLLLAARKGTDEKKELLEQIDDKRVVVRLKSGFLSFIFIGLIGLAFMWLFYIPHTINMPPQVQRDLIAQSGVGPFTRPLQAMSGNFITRPLAQWFLGFAMVTSHVQGGHDAFLLGQASNSGWWYYYPVALALKTQIPIFVFLILMIALWKWLDKRDWFTEVYLWILPIVLLLMGMQGKINLGVRYMLPIYAFMFVSVSKLATKFEFRSIVDQVKRKGKDIKDKWVTILVSIATIVLLFWYILSAILIYPYYLAYYNEFVGGYKNGYKYLTDSNTDWGQDLKRLKTWMEENNVNKVYLDYFGGGSPKYYLGDKYVEWHPDNGIPKGVMVVSATLFQGSRFSEMRHTGYSYPSILKPFKPVEIIGGSLLIYDFR